MINKQKCRDFSDGFINIAKLEHLSEAVKLIRGSLLNQEQQVNKEQCRMDIADQMTLIGAKNAEN